MGFEELKTTEPEALKTFIERASELPKEIENIPELGFGETSIKPVLFKLVNAENVKIKPSEVAEHPFESVISTEYNPDCVGEYVCAVSPFIKSEPENH